MDNNESWKTLVNWKRLSSASIVGDEQVVTIKECKKEEIINTKTGKTETVATMYFEDAMPCVMCKTNFKEIARIFGSENYKTWYGKKIILYKKNGIRYGKEITSGIRVKEYNAKKYYCEYCGNEVKYEIWNGSKSKYGYGVCSAECRDKLLKKGE